MVAAPWHPTDPVVECHCDGCDRGLPTYLRDPAETVRVELAPLPGDDAATTTVTFCGDCAVEVSELLDATTPAGEPAYPTSHADLRATTACGFCDRAFDGPARVLTARWRGDRLGSEHRMPLCAHCDDVVEEFLGNVPDEQPSGDVYYGEAPDVGVPVGEADRDALLAAFDAVRVGDDVRLESHERPERATPAAYHVVSGRVLRREAGMGIEDLVIEAGDERYRLTRPAPTVDRLTLRRETPAGTDPLGEVTVLDAETTPESRSRSREDSGIDADAIDLDADSALIPDSLDLESSAD